MKKRYTLSQQYIAIGLLVSLCLQSCGGGFDNNPLIPIQKEQTERLQPESQQIIPLANIQTLVDQTVTAQGGHMVTCYQENGKLKADVAMNIPQGFSKSYEGVNVYIEQGAELTNLFYLDKKEQENRIHLQLAKGEQPAKVVIYKGAGLMGGMQEGEEEPTKEKSSKKDSTSTRKSLDDKSKCVGDNSGVDERSENEKTRTGKPKKIGRHSKKDTRTIKALCLKNKEIKHITPKLSISRKRLEGEYSSSDEDDAPHFNGVYNLTKYSILPDEDPIDFRPSDSDEEEEREKQCKNRDKNKKKDRGIGMRGANSEVFNNYVEYPECIFPAQLVEDALAIRGNIPSNHISILCVALKQDDNRIKKFVFTTLPSLYRLNDVTIQSIAERSHERGYHLIMAQQAHAEGELIQFLQERPTRYTHLVAMGCDKNHCALCSSIMNTVFSKNWRDFADLTQASIESYLTHNWYLPTALEQALKDHKVSIRKLKEYLDKNSIPYYKEAWINQERHQKND